jgi:hypothetical protein
MWYYTELIGFTPQPIYPNEIAPCLDGIGQWWASRKADCPVVFISLFVVYITTLLVALIALSRKVGWLVNNELETMKQEAVFTCLICCYGSICTDGLRITRRNLSRCPYRGTNVDPQNKNENLCLFSQLRPVRPACSLVIGQGPAGFKQHSTAGCYEQDNQIHRIWLLQATA